MCHCEREGKNVADHVVAFQHHPTPPPPPHPTPELQLAFIKMILIMKAIWLTDQNIQNMKLKKLSPILN
jgi:hypothetical protein